MKPRVFIGSSGEALPYAHGLQELLESEADCTVWPQAVFGLSRSTFDELDRKLSAFDAAIFVFAPDDTLVSRGVKYRAARDNVIFELGLFAGRCGFRRSFIVAPSDQPRFHLPSDLLGFGYAGYQSKREDGNINAALGSACNKIRRELREMQGRRNHHVGPAQKQGFFSDFKPQFSEMMASATRVDLFFIHSRRWRENHFDDLERFLSRGGTKLTVFLPNLDNKVLMRAICGHFPDGVSIPQLIRDSYDMFRNCRRRFPKKVQIRTCDVYPTYSFYRFDGQIVMALYPTTCRKRDVPTWQFDSMHPFGEFILEDLSKLESSHGR